jgi:hypothetical protein
LALAKLHNFCIEQTDTSILPVLPEDEFRLVTQASRSIPLEDGGAHDDRTDENLDNDDRMDENIDDGVVPVQLIGGGEHFEDVPGEIRQIRGRRYNNIRLPKGTACRGFCQGKQLSKTKTKRNMIATYGKATGSTTAGCRSSLAGLLTVD